MNFIKRYWLEIILLFILAIGLYLVVISFKAYAHEKDCRHHDCDYPTPTPTVECSITPSPTVTPTEEITPTVSPSVIPTETPMPSVSVTPKQPDNNTGGGSTGGTGMAYAPAAVTCNIPFSAPVIVSFKALGHGTVQFDYLNSEEGISKFSAIYGYASDQLIYGVDNLPATSRSLTITGLQPGRNVWLQMWNWKNGCAEKSELFDPIIR